MQRILPSNANLVPENAKKVFEGEIFDVYQWDEKFFDGTPATFEMLKRPDTVKIIALKGNKIIVVEDIQPSSKPKITFPGGRIEQSDGSWLEAAKREMLEETGLEFKTWKLIEVNQPISKIEWFVAWYIASDFSDQISPQNDFGEKIKVFEYDIDNCFSNIFDKNNPETKYLPYSLKPGIKIEDILKIQEYVGTI